jgi:hypothetical protein
MIGETWRGETCDVWGSSPMLAWCMCDFWHGRNSISGMATTTPT